MVFIFISPMTNGIESLGAYVCDERLNNLTVGQSNLVLIPTWLVTVALLCIIGHVWNLWKSFVVSLLSESKCGTILSKHQKDLLY
jgi:hypothetical protein